MFGLRQNKYTEACGWYGMIAVMAAYGLASFGVFSAESFAYQLLNISGGIGLFIITAAKKVTQSVILNIFWIVIGVIAVIRLIAH